MFVIVDEYFCDSVRMLVNQVRIHRIAMFRNVAACRSNLINWAGENDSLIHQYFLLKKIVLKTIWNGESVDKI